MRDKILYHITIYENGMWRGASINLKQLVDVSFKYEDKSDEELFEILMQAIDERIESVY
jgi:hypothetical protein